MNLSNSAFRSATRTKQRVLAPAGIRAHGSGLHRRPPHAADEMDRLWLRADCCEISTPSVLVRAQWVDACWADGTKGFVCSVCGEAVGAQFNRCACDVFHFENRCQAATAFAPSSTALPILPAQVVGTLATEKAAKKRRVYRPRVLSKPVPKGQPAVYFRANVD